MRYFSTFKLAIRFWRCKLELGPATRPIAPPSPWLSCSLLLSAPPPLSIMSALSTFRHIRPFLSFTPDMDVDLVCLQDFRLLSFLPASLPLSYTLFSTIPPTPIFTSRVTYISRREYIAWGDRIAFPSLLAVILRPLPFLTLCVFPAPVPFALSFQVLCQRFSFSLTYGTSTSIVSLPRRLCRASMPFNFFPSAHSICRFSLVRSNIR